MRHPKIVFTKDKNGDLTIKKVDKYILQDADVNICLIIGEILRQYARNIDMAPQEYIDKYGDCDEAYNEFIEQVSKVGTDFIWLANNKFSIKPEIQEKYDMLSTICFDWLKNNLDILW